MLKVDVSYTQFRQNRETLDPLYTTTVNSLISTSLKSFAVQLSPHTTQIHRVRVARPTAQSAT